MIDAQRSFDGIGRAKHHRILAGKLFGIPAEIILFKASSIIPPMIPCCQLRPEQPQGLLCELVHLRVESVVFQLAVQFLLFDFQFPPLYRIELASRISGFQHYAILCCRSSCPARLMSLLSSSKPLNYRLSFRCFQFWYRGYPTQQQFVFGS